MTELSDEQLRTELATYGFKAGPINETTKKVYIKKLEMLKINGKKDVNKATPTKKPNPPVSKVIVRQEEEIPKPVNNNSRPVVITKIPREKSIEKKPESIDLTNSQAPAKVTKSYFTITESESDDEVEATSKPNQSFDFNKSSLGRKSFSRFLNDSQNNTVGISAQSSLLFTPERNSIPRKSRLSCFSRFGANQTAQQNESINLSQSAYQRPKKPNTIYESPQDTKFSSVNFSSNLQLVIIAIALSGLLYFITNNLKSESEPTGAFGAFEISHLICKENSLAINRNCIKSSIKDKVIIVFKDLINILGRYAGCYHCQTPFNDHSLPPSTPSLPIDVAKSLVIGYMMNDENIQNVWQGILLILKDFGPERSGILMNFVNGDKINSLESLVPQYTLLCRIHFLYNWLAKWVWYISVVSMTSVLLFLFSYIFYICRRNAQERKNQLENKIQEITAFIIDILQSSQLENERNGNKTPANVPLSKIKLQVQAKFPVANQQMWDVVCARIRERESCIIEECLRGLGDTWRWRSGVGWQGSALADSGVNSSKISKPPSECLKIRNMFLSEGSLSPEQESRIRRQLFQKINQCGGICHMSLVTNDNSLNSSMSNSQISSNSNIKSGIVYVLCMSPDVAAQVYNSVNAHYFDSRLVIAKFITLERYYQRFPEAANALRALNDQDFE